MRLAKGLLAMSLLCAGVISSASATEVNTVNVNTNNSLSAENIAETRGFTRTYKQYLSENDTTEIDLMSDENWDIWGDNKVTVTLKGVPNTTAKVRTRVYYMTGSGWQEVSSGAYDLQKNKSRTWNIPAGADFKVTVAWGQGLSGDYKFEVKLS